MFPIRSRWVCKVRHGRERHASDPRGGSKSRPPGDQDEGSRVMNGLDQGGVDTASVGGHSRNREVGQAGTDIVS